MEEIVDMVGEPIPAYFVHFSEKGITPEILRIEGFEILVLRRAEGPRLGETLKRDPANPKLPEIYKKLGFSVGYISKYGISHGHLHTYNVVLENNSPIIIDWGQASYLGISGIDLWLSGNANFLLKSTKEDLTIAKRPDLYAPLESIFIKEFKKEMAIPQSKTPREIQMETFKRFGVI